MPTFKITDSQLDKTNPKIIFDTYLRLVKRAKPKNHYENKNNTIVEHRLGKKSRVLMSYDKNSKAWILKGTKLRAIETAIKVGLTSPYLRLYRDNLKREEGNRSLLGVSPCLNERAYYKDNCAFSMAFSENLSKVVNYLIKTDTPTIDDIVNVMDKNKKVLAEKVGAASNLYFKKRVNNDKQLYFTEVYLNDDRFSGAYTYLESEMSKRFSDMVPMDPHHPDFYSQKTLVPFRIKIPSSQTYQNCKVFGMLKLWQLGEKDFSFNKLFTSNGAGNQPRTYLNDMVYKDYTFKPSEHVFTEDIFKTSCWSLTSTYFDTKDIELEIFGIKIDYIGGLVASAMLPQSQVRLSLGGAESFIQATQDGQEGMQEIVARYNESLRKIGNTNNISVKAGIARAQYVGHSHEVAILSCSTRTVRQVDRDLYGTEESDIGIVIMHPSTDFGVINDILKSTSALIKDLNRSTENKDAAIRSVAKLMYTLVLQTPFQNGTRTISEILGQSLLYLIAHKCQEISLMRYWCKFKNTTWDFLVHGHNISSQLKSESLDRFTHDFMNQIIVGETWSCEQAQFIKSKVNFSTL